MDATIEGPDGGGVPDEVVMHGRRRKYVAWMLLFGWLPAAVIFMPEPGLPDFALADPLGWLLFAFVMSWCWVPILHPAKLTLGKTGFRYDTAFGRTRWVAWEDVDRFDVIEHGEAPVLLGVSAVSWHLTPKAARRLGVKKQSMWRGRRFGGAIQNDFNIPVDDLDMLLSHRLWAAIDPPDDEEFGEDSPEA